MLWTKVCCMLHNHASPSPHCTLPSPYTHTQTPSLCVSVCAVCGVYNHNLVFDGSEMKMGFTAREAINKGKSCGQHVNAM